METEITLAEFQAIVAAAVHMERAKCVEVVNEKARFLARIALEKLDVAGMHSVVRLQQLILEAIRERTAAEKARLG